MTDNLVSSPMAQPPKPTQTINPLAKDIRGGSFALIDLYRASIQAGGGAVLEGRTFTDCFIEGPAVMLVLENTHFDGVNFGPTGGDMRSMLFRSLNGTHAIGAIPVRNCTFKNCSFHTLGITGNEPLLQMLIDQVTPVG